MRMFLDFLFERWNKLFFKTWTSNIYAKKVPLGLKMASNRGVTIKDSD